MPFITDQSIVPYPEEAPALGHAGSIITDPFCGSEILRVTDRNTANGASFSTNSASECSTWAADTSSFVVVNRQTGGNVRYSFDADNMAIAKLGPLPIGGAEFSWRNPNLMWGNTGLKIEQLDLSTGKVKVMIDLAQHPEIGIPATPRWYLNSASSDYWDNRVAFNLGPQQNENYILLCFDVDLGLDFINTQTGLHEGWAGSNQLANWTPFSMHDSRINKSGTVIRTGFATGGERVFWRPGTPIYQALKSSKTTPMDGHSALGFNTYFGGYLGVVPFQFLIAPFWHIDAWQNLMKPVPQPITGWWSDYHISVRPEPDRKPIYISAYNAQGNPKTPNTPLTSKAPGDNEIFALATDLSGRWWRYAHHYASGQGNFYASPRGNVSPDGKWFMFTSDWEMTLGGTYPNQRTDVFILRIDS